MKIVQSQKMNKLRLEKLIVKTNTTYQKMSKRNSIKVKSRLIIQIDDSLNLLQLQNISNK